MQMLCISTLFRDATCEKHLILLGENELERVKGIEPSTSEGRGTVFNLPVSHETG